MTPFNPAHDDVNLVFLTSDDEDVLATPTSSRAPPSATSPKRRYSILDDSDSEAVDDARPPLFRARERTASPDVDPFGRRPRNSGANAARYAAAAPGGDGNSSDDGDDSDGGDRPNHAEQGRGAPRNRRAEGDDRATSPGAGYAQPNIDPVRLVRPDQVRDFVRLFGAEGTVFRDEIGSTYTVAKAYKRYNLTTLVQDGDEYRMPLLPLDGTYQHHVRDATGIPQRPWKLIAKRCDDAMLQTGLGVEISRYGKWKRIPNDLRERFLVLAVAQAQGPLRGKTFENNWLFDYLGKYYADCSRAATKRHRKTVLAAAGNVV